MKKLTVFSLLLVLSILLFCGRLHAEGLTSWTLGGQDIDSAKNEIFARVGYEKGAVELGIESAWWPKWNPPQVWGAYGIYKFEELIKVPNPVQVEWLPAELSATGYIGGHVTVDFDNEGSYYGPVAGTMIQDILCIEYQYRVYGRELESLIDESEHRIVFGIRHAF